MLVNGIPFAILAAVTVAADGPCLDATLVTATLEGTLAAASAGGTAVLAVSVDVRPEGAGHTVSLAASTRDGGEVLARRFALADADCAQGAALLEAVLARFLDSFPREKWTLPPPSPLPSTAPKRQLFGIAPRISGDLGLLPSSEDPLIADTSGDFEVGIAPHRSGVSGELVLRVGTWSSVGEGRYQPLTALAGAGWAWVGDVRSARIGLRSGVLAIRADRRAAEVSEKLLPWVEAHADVAWPIGPVRIGPQIALSLIRVNAETADGNARRAVPTNRIGIRLEFPL